MTMQDEERRRIAREMHDGLGQELVAAKMILDGILAKDTSPQNGLTEPADRTPGIATPDLDVTLTRAELARQMMAS